MAGTRLGISELIRRAGDLPPLPHVAQKALEIIRNPASDMADLAEVLSLDTALSGLVLRWANSPYYGPASTISTVQQAVTYLGHNTVQSLLFSAWMSAFTDRPAPGYALERGELWQHSVGVAAGARLVAQRISRELGDDAYYAGLLCDIGKLVFDSVLRDVDTSGPEWQGKPFSDLEAEFFGIDHAALGAEVIRHWKLPSKLEGAVAYHHCPSRAPGDGLLASAVHIADAAMMMMGIGLGRDGLQYAVDPVAVERMKWTDAAFGELVEKVVPFVKEAEQFIKKRK